MKKFNYLLTAITIGAMSIVGCDPVEDINDQLEANEAGIFDVFDYTLTEDDYKETLELGYANFNTVDDAKTLIPTVLNTNFPVLGDASLANVSYDLYAPVSTESSLIVYTVSTADYDANPDTAQYNNFDDEEQIYTFLDSKFPNVANRTLVSLTYVFYNGSSQTLNNGFLRVNGEWQFVLGLTSAEYTAVGQGFANFNTEDEALRKLPIFLLDKFKYEEIAVNTVKSTMYKLYTTDVDDIDGDGSKTDRATYSYIVNFIYDGSSWSEYNNTLRMTLQFGNDSGIWVPDNTVAYSFTQGDIALVSSTLLTKYPGPADNVGFFKSFDRRSGSSNYWSDDMMIEAIGIVLDSINPNAEEDQKYAVTVVIYNGSTTNETFFLIKTDGAWVTQ